MIEMKLLEKIAGFFRRLAGALKCGGAAFRSADLRALGASAGSRPDALRAAASLESGGKWALIRESSGRVALEVVPSEGADGAFLAACSVALRSEAAKMVGPAFDRDLEKYDRDLAMAYKEADYQMARADAAQSGLDYFRAINDAYGPASDELLRMWNVYKAAKAKLESFGE